MAEPVTPNTPTRFIGCDVGKTLIVVCDSRDGSTRTLANTPEALAGFAARLDTTCLVVCEATGGYEDALLAALLAAGCPAHRADARKNSDEKFAQSIVSISQNAKIVVETI